MTRKGLILLAPCVLLAGAVAPAVAATTCDTFGTIDIAGKTSVVQNNKWNSAATGAQCVTANESTGAFSVSTQNNTCSFSGGPCGYPSIFKGCHWGNCTSSSGLPLQVSSITQASTSWTVATVPGSWNVSYDIWFDSRPSTSGQPNGAELMIWINHQGPPQPIGSRRATVSIGGADWDVWIGNIGWNVISYVRNPVTTSVNLNLLSFFNDARSRGQVQAAWWLHSIQAGFEIWQGGAGMRSDSFSASFSSGATPRPTATPTATPASGISTTAWYSLVNQTSSKCVDRRGGGTANGTAVQQYACNNTYAQQWQFQATNGGYYRLAARGASSQVIDVSGVSLADGALIHLWSWVGGNNQQWLPQSLGNGYYRLVARHSGKCLDVPGASTADSVQLVQYACNGTGAQSFRLMQQP